MKTGKRWVTSYIRKRCASIVPIVFKMKIKPKKRIQSVKRHLEEVAESDVENKEISTGQYQDVLSFIEDNEKFDENKILRHIINKYHLQMLKQNLDKTKRKLRKTADDNLKLGERNGVLQRQRTKLEDRWTKAHFRYMDMRAENASLSAKIKELGQELHAFKQGVLQEERDANAVLVAENIGLKKALEAANRNLACPITLAPFQNPVYCSDGYTYEEEAINDWIRTNGTSPMTRQPISIIGLNRAIQNVIAAIA